MSQEEHVDDAGGPVAPVDQSIALVAQRGWKVPRAEPLVSDVIDAGTDQLRQDICVHVCSWLDQERRSSEREQLEEAAGREKHLETIVSSPPLTCISR